MTETMPEKVERQSARDFIRNLVHDSRTAKANLAFIKEFREQTIQDNEDNMEGRPEDISKTIERFDENIAELEKIIPELEAKEAEESIENSGGTAS